MHIMGSAGQEAARVILSILLLIMDYAGTLQVLAGKAYDRRSARASGGVLALLFVFAGIAFGCMSFAMRSSLCMLLLCLIVTVFLAAAGMVHFLAENRGNVRTSGLVCLIFSLFLILGAAIFTRNGASNSQVRMELFWVSGDNSAYWWRHAMLNAVLFLPCGGSLALIGGRKRLTLLQSILTGMMISTFVELIQLVFHLGQCDINDILFNTLGTAAGFGCVKLFMRENSDSGERT